MFHSSSILRSFPLRAETTVDLSGSSMLPFPNVPCSLTPPQSPVTIASCGDLLLPSSQYDAVGLRVTIITRLNRYRGRDDHYWPPRTSMDRPRVARELIGWACGPLQSIRPLVGACAPGHHGNPRAAVLIRSKASRAMCGARFQLRRGDHCSIVLTSLANLGREAPDLLLARSHSRHAAVGVRGIVSASIIEYRPRDARELVG